MRDLVGLARGGGVVAAHDALDARELDDGARHEVGLAQMRGARGVGGVLGAERGVGGEVLGELLDAGRLGAHGAELLLEHDGVEALHVILQRTAQVLVVEELGVVEARGDDALVAIDDVGLERRIAVGGDQELVGERAVGVEQREVALVHEHRVDRDLLGDGQEQLIERAHHDRRELGEVDDLLHGLGGKLGHQAGLLLDLGDLGADGRLALLLAGDDLGAAQDADQVGGVGDLVRSGREEAVAARGAAGREPGELHRDDLVVEQRQKPADRTAELLVAAAPTLGLGPRDRGDEAGQDGGQEVGGRLRGRALDGPHVLGAVLVAALERGGVDALAAREAKRGLGGIALLVEGDLDRRTAELLHGLLGGLWQPAHDGDQAARRREDGDLLEGDAGAGERLLHQAAQLERGGMQIERGQFLGADLECKRLIRHRRPPFLPRRLVRRRAGSPWRPRRRRSPGSWRSTPWRSCGRAGCSPCARWRR